MAGAEQVPDQGTFLNILPRKSNWRRLWRRDHLVATLEGRFEPLGFSSPPDKMQGWNKGSAIWFPPPGRAHCTADTAAQCAGPNAHRLPHRPGCAFERDDYERAKARARGTGS